MKWQLLALVGLALAPVVSADDGSMGAQSPMLHPGQTWSLAFTSAGTVHYHCHEHPDMMGMVQVAAGAPAMVIVTINDTTFGPEIASVAPGGSIEWRNMGNTTHTVSFVAGAAMPYSGFHPVVLTVIIGSALLGLVLIVFGARAFRRTGEASMAFVAGAFTVFVLKNSLVAFSLHTLLIQHEVLELLDSVGDLGVVLLLVFPILLARRR